MKVVRSARRVGNGGGQLEAECPTFVNAKSEFTKLNCVYFVKVLINTIIIMCNKMWPL